MFQPVYSYFKKIANSDHISACKYKEMSDESATPPAVFRTVLLKH